MAINDDEIIVSTIETMHLIQNPEEGEKCWVEENEQCYVYQNGEWIQKKSNKMTLYELNKVILAQMPTYTKEDVQKAKTIFIDYKNNYPGQYYLLLSREAGYYTVFACDENADESMEDIIIECLMNLGDIKSIQYQETGSVEIWVSIEKEPYIFYFFIYDEGVVECR